MEPSLSSSGDATSTRKPNEFCLSDIAAGQIGLVIVDGERVAVHNVDGAFYATQDRCVHASWPLSDGGELSGTQLTCPLHYWCFDVTTGEVVRGMKSLRLRTYRVVLRGELGCVEPNVE